MQISVVGDFCPIGRFHSDVSNIYKDGVFAALSPYISKSQLSIANLECPVANEGFTKIKKQGPSLKCSKEDVKYLKESGFNLVTLANNHIKDYGEVGIEETIKCINDIGLGYVGAGRNLNEAAKVFYYNNGDAIVAIINCCEHEFSIATEESFGANPLDVVNQWYQIQEAKSKADYVIIIVHGGTEHYSLPTPRMKKTYRFFVEAGADVVINHHQHCCSGYEKYKGKPILYGIGNFCFDFPGHTDEKWHLGLLVTLELGEAIDFELIPFHQYYREQKIVLLDTSERDSFFRFIQQINSIIEDDRVLNESFINLCKEKANGMLLNFMPYSNKYLKYMAYKKWLPSFVQKQRLLGIFDMVNCESHRDILLEVLNKEMYGNN